MKSQRMAITLPPQQASLLRKIAEAEKISVSQVISVLIDKLVYDTLENEKLGKEEVQ